MFYYDKGIQKPKHGMVAASDTQGLLSKYTDTEAFSFIVI